MTVILFVLAVAVVAAFAAAWYLGRSEPVYAVTAGEPSWFVALKYRDPSQAPRIELAHGVHQRWSVRADFTFIGVGDKHWDRFMVLSGATAQQRLPVLLNDDFSDAYIVRLQHGVPPALVLGLFRLLFLTGIWSTHKGEVSTDLAHTGARLDAMPSPENIAVLLSKPLSYAPVMVNFLKYLPSANYGNDVKGESVSGAKAYGRYGVVALQSVYKTGGRLAFFARVAEVLLDAKDGLTKGRWDTIAVMEYSEPKSILSMEQLPKYKAALKHRDAGLDRTVIVTSSHDHHGR